MIAIRIQPGSPPATMRTATGGGAKRRARGGAELLILFCGAWDCWDQLPGRNRDHQRRLASTLFSQPGRKYLTAVFGLWYNARMTEVQAADALLDQLAGAPNVRADHAPSMTQIGKVSYTHDAIIDLVVENPTLSQGEIAKKMGYTESWLSHIFNSDTFQVRLAERKDALIDPRLRASIKERFEVLTRLSLDVLEEKLRQPAAKVSDNVALRAAELGARSLGMGRSEAPPPPPAGDRLIVLSERLVGLLSVQKEAINGQAQRLPETHEHAEGSYEVPREAAG